MKWFFVPVLTILYLCGCQNSNTDKHNNIISQRYIHKYGYDVSKEEWQSTNYPGKVVTTLRNGVTITSSYENGVLHGPMTYTFPHSNTCEVLNIYEKGNLVKKTIYNIRGIPQKETSFLSPSHTKITHWYKSGTPLYVEEYHNDELLEGEYYNEYNEPEYRVVKGSGIRIIRNQHEKIAAKETIDNGYPVIKETFHPHGIPHTITPLSGGKINGVRKVFAPSGEPVSIETYENNVLHGLATYFQNGCRYLELHYTSGLKNGIERHFVDGQIVIEETEWLDGHKHGPSVVFFDGISKTTFYYNNLPVSKERYRELCEQEENIAIMHDRAMGKE